MMYAILPFIGLFFTFSSCSMHGRQGLDIADTFYCGTDPTKINFVLIKDSLDPSNGKYLKYNCNGFIEETFEAVDIDSINPDLYFTKWGENYKYDKVGNVLFRGYYLNDIYTGFKYEYNEKNEIKHFGAIDTSGLYFLMNDIDLHAGDMLNYEGRFVSPYSILTIFNANDKGDDTLAGYFNIVEPPIKGFASKVELRIIDTVSRKVVYLLDGAEVINGCFNFEAIVRRDVVYEISVVYKLIKNNEIFFETEYNFGTVRSRNSGM